MPQFALFAGLIITTLILNTIVFLLSVFLLYSLPDSVNSSVMSYAGILIAFSLLAWLILLGGGSAILHQERHGYSSMPLKLGIMITVLLLYTVVFILSCILISVFENDLQQSLVNARNYTASVLALVFVAWVLMLSGCSLLATSTKAAVVVEQLTEPLLTTYRPESLSSYRPESLSSYRPESRSTYPESLSSYRRPQGRAYGMTCGMNY